MTQTKNDNFQAIKQVTRDNFQNGWNVFLIRMGKLAEQRHMAALRDGFALIVPLIIAASLGVICMTFIFGWWQTTETSILGWITWGIPGQVYTKYDAGTKLFTDFVPGSVAHQISSTGTFIFYTIWKGIFSFLSIFVALTISYSLARVRNVKDPYIASLVGLGAFMILSYGDTSLFGANGMLVAILASLLSIELYSIFERSKKLELKMPAGVPPAVARSFSKLFPTIFTLFIMIGLQAPFLIISMWGLTTFSFDGFGLGHALTAAIQAPFIQMVSNPNASLGIGLAYTFFTALLWFFGIHGTNVLMGVFSPVALQLLAQNQAFKAGEAAANVTGFSTFADGTWDAFMFFGGTGTTLALVLIGLFISKIKATREILKFGGPSAVFNINEPLLFGIPLILNFTYVIPFIIVQPILYFITWLAIEQFGWVPGVIVKIPWTTPVGIGGFLATSSWQGIILALFNFALACGIYTPFIMMANRKAKKHNEELIKIDYKGGWDKIVNKVKKTSSKIKGVSK